MGPGPMGPGGPMGPYGGPPRKKSPLPLILGLGGGGFAFLIIIIAIVAAIGGGDDEPTSQSTNPYPSSSYSYSYSPSTSSTGTETGTATSTESTSGSEVSGQYGTPEDNKVYETGVMDGVNCDAQLSDPFTSADYKEYGEKIQACLDQAWEAQLTTQGITFQKPSAVYSESNNPSSPCQSSGANYVPAAFYCPTNQTIYYNMPAATESPAYHVLRTPAHEYAHHVQTLTGINETYNTRYYEKQGDTAATTLLTRRSELQAQCFAGIFLSPNSSTMNVDRGKLEEMAKRTGDDPEDSNPANRTHGKPVNNTRWLMNEGWDKKDAGACNTWTAPENDVG